MNKFMFGVLLALIAGAASAQRDDRPAGQLGDVHAPDQVASASIEDPSYAIYRRVVLGDTRVVLPAALAPLDAGIRFVPGSYARYLMQNGMSQPNALAQSKLIGEALVLITNEPASMSPQLSSYELYQRTVLGRSDTEIERNRSVAKAWAAVDVSAQSAH